MRPLLVLVSTINSRHWNANRTYLQLLSCTEMPAPPSSRALLLGGGSRPPQQQRALDPALPAPASSPPPPPPTSARVLAVRSRRLCSPRPAGSRRVRRETTTGFGVDHKFSPLER